MSGMRTSLLLMILFLSLQLFAQIPNNELSISYGKGSFKNDIGDASNEAVGSFSYNRFWTPAVSTRLGVTEFGVGPATDFGGASGIDISAKTLAVEWHIRRDRLVSPYAGIGAAYVSTSLATRHLTASSDNEFTGFVTAGIDLNLARWFAIGATSSLMPYEPALSPGGHQVDLSPLSVSGALKFRW
jgi:outer membrane protein W